MNKEEKQTLKKQREHKSNNTPTSTKNKQKNSKKQKINQKKTTHKHLTLPNPNIEEQSTPNKPPKQAFLKHMHL